MSAKLNADLLSKHWVHSHEEDTGDEMVFRPSTYNFPLSRGRTSFDLKPGGDLVESGPGPTDRTQKAQGTWKLEGGDKLALFDKLADAPKQIMRIASATADRLVIHKGDG